MKCGILLAVHNKIDDLLANLDILKFYPEVEKLIVCSYPLPEMQDLSGYRIKFIKTNRQIGPLIALTTGLRMAQHLDVICYRNADDWLFNHDFTRSIFQKMEDFACAGYNWLSVNSNIDYTLNELFLRVKDFTKTIDYAENYFTTSRPWTLEYKMATWINYTTNSFYRIPGREQEPGIGHLGDIEGLLEKSGIPVEETREKLKNNNRWFNRAWQLIGSHDIADRMEYYNSIRNEIPYHEELEKEKHFSRWLNMPNTWNIPIEGMYSELNKQFQEIMPEKKVYRKPFIIGRKCTQPK